MSSAHATCSVSWDVKRWMQTNPPDGWGEAHRTSGRLFYRKPCHLLVEQTICWNCTTRAQLLSSSRTKRAVAPDTNWLETPFYTSSDVYPMACTGSDVDMTGGIGSVYLEQSFWGLYGSVTPTFMPRFCWFFVFFQCEHCTAAMISRPIHLSVWFLSAGFDFLHRRAPSLWLTRSWSTFSCGHVVNNDISTDFRGCWRLPLSKISYIFDP